MNPLKKLMHCYHLIKLMNDACGSLLNIPKVVNLDVIYKNFDAFSLELHDSSSLDIGCGDAPRNPFRAQNVYGVDIRENLKKSIQYADLSVERIPFDDSKFDYISAFDFLEHIPRILYAPDRRFPFVELMNEIYRTLKPGGFFFSYTPIYPFSAAFRDPTHVNIITGETFLLYFDEKITHAKIYGFKGRFSVRYQGRTSMHLVSILQKI